MTDQTNDPDISIQIELIPDGVIELHSVAFGHGVPKILLTVEEDDEGDLTFSAIGAGFDGHRELIEMARQHLDVLELGVEQSENDAEEAQ